MNASIWFRTAAVTAALVAASAAHAAPTLLVTSEGYLTGAQNVDVGGSLYDVQFLSGSCDSVFAGCSPSKFSFDRQVSATAAASALQTVFVDGPAGKFDSQASMTLGCGSVCHILIPFMSFGTDPNGTVNSAAFNNQSGGTTDSLGVYGFNSSFDLANLRGPARGFLYADFVAVVSDVPVVLNGVPEPTSVFLFAIGGIAAYGAARRRRSPA